MVFKDEVFEYIKFLRKYISIIIGIYILIEAAIFIKIGLSNKLVFIGSLFIIFFLLCTSILMFKDLRTCILFYCLSMPIMPILLYLYNRLDLPILTWVSYGMYALIFIINVILHKKEINHFKINNKYKTLNVLALYFIVSALITSLLSKSKGESLVFFVFGIAFVAFFCFIIINYKMTDIDLIQQLILYLGIGVVFSGMPDFIVSLYNLIFRGKNTHLYGSLGSNFMLGYTIMILPFLLYYAFNKELCSKYNNIFRVLCFSEVFILSTQRSRGILVTIILMVIMLCIFDKKNRKKYFIYGLIVSALIGYNVSQRWELSDLSEDIQLNGFDIRSNSKSFLALTARQFKNRRPIWAIALLILNDHLFFGVGLGNFKYYYIQYAPEALTHYIDAHNIFFNVSTELGIVFSLVFFTTMFIILIKSLKKTLTNKNFKGREILYCGALTIISLMIYGNITGQAFINTAFPVSFVPVNVFMIIITSMVYILKNMESIRK